jgi:hypothetical protein
MGYGTKKHLGGKMEPVFMIEPSYTKEEMKQFGKECWEKFDNTRVITGFRIFSVIFTVAAIFGLLIGFIPISDSLFWSCIIILNILIILMPKGSSCKGIGIGINLMANIFHKTFNERIVFYVDHVDCREFQNIQYRDMEIIEYEERLTVKLQRRYFLINKSGFVLGSYNDLKDFLYLKKQEESV